MDTNHYINEQYKVWQTKCLPTILLYIFQHGGNQEDAEDVFQDAVCLLIGKLQDGFKPEKAELSTYLISMCRNIWLKRIRDRKGEYLSLSDSEMEDKLTHELISDDAPIEDKIWEALRRINHKCMKLLYNVYWLGQSMAELQILFGQKKRQSTFNAKFRCLTQLREKYQELESQVLFSEVSNPIG